MARKSNTSRTFVIKFFNKNLHCYYYLSRMPSKDNNPEFNHDCNEALRFTSEEAQTAHETLRKFFCDRSRTVDEAYYQASLSFFGDLYIADTGPTEIIDGEAKAFLLWADKYHHDALADMFKEYLASQKEPPSEDGIPHPNEPVFTNTPMSTDTPSTYEEHMALQESRRLMAGTTMEPSKSPSSTPRDYEKENDLGVYVHCVERMDQIAAIKRVYGENMTIKEVYESVKYQLEKYRKLVIGR